MHARVVAVSLVGTVVATAGAIVAFVLSGSSAYIPDWPSLGIAGWVCGSALILLGLLGPVLTLGWTHPTRTALDGAVTGLLTVVTPAYLVVGPWLGLVWSERGRVQAEAGPLEGLAFAELFAWLTIDQVLWVPVVATSLTLMWPVMAGCITAVLGAPLIPPVRPFRMSWFPVWVLYACGVTLVVQTTALNTLGQNLGAALGNQVGWVPFALDFLPLFLLTIQAIAVGTTARQVPPAWVGNDRVGATAIGALVSLFVLIELGALALLNPMWAMLFLVTVLIAILVGASFAWMDEPPPLARGSAPLPHVLLRALGLTLLGAVLILGPGGILMGLMTALTTVTIIGPLAGNGTPVSEVRDGLAEVWPLLAWCWGSTAGALVVLFSIGSTVRWAVRRALHGPAAPAQEEASAAPHPAGRYIAPPHPDDPFSPPGYAD